MDGAWAVGSDGGEEVLRLQVVGDLLQFLSVPGEEYAAGPWAITNTDHITLHIFRAVGDSGERLIVAPLTV